MKEKPQVDGSSLPFPQTPTASIVGRTLAESKHQWRQEPKRLPDNAPNIVIFMSDDAGFSNPDTFGGPVHTPTLAKLAEGGIAYYSLKGNQPAANAKRAISKLAEHVAAQVCVPRNPAFNRNLQLVLPVAAE